jgi:Tfp pilus assembly protein PilE
MKGFSTLEIIIVIAVAGILLAIGVNSFQVAQIKKNQDEIIQTLTTSLDEQKVNTQTGKNGQQYGVRFNLKDFVLFSGTSYNPSSDQNKIIAINSQFEITETLSNSDNIIYFSKLIGDVNEIATITISHIDNRIDPQKIIIEKSGAISVIE